MYRDDDLAAHVQDDLRRSLQQTEWERRENEFIASQYARTSDFPVAIVMEWGDVEQPEQRIIALAVDEDMASRIREGLALTYGDHVNAAFYSRQLADEPPAGGRGQA